MTGARRLLPRTCSRIAFQVHPALPAPSMTTTSYWFGGGRARREPCAGLGFWLDMTAPAPDRFARTTCDRGRPPASENRIHIDGRDHRAAAPHRRAPDLAPSGVTKALRAMFCAFEGATESPCRANSRHSAVVMMLLPTDEAVLES
jgi:hypothetical protein